VYALSLIYASILLKTKIMYTDFNMAKRETGVGKKKKSRSPKTKKRLAIKHEMLAQRAAKKKKK